MKEKSLRAYYVFSPAIRIFHWIMVLAIFVLFFTGLYIGDPFFIGTQGTEATFAITNIFSMEMMRYVHFIFAYLLTVSLILRIYGFIINKGDRLLPHFWTRRYWFGLVDTTLHYLFLRDQHTPYLRNSLARTGYLFVYIMILLEIVTGFAMYVMINPNSFAAKVFGPFNHLFINEYNVHIIHHYAAWGIMLFVIVHIYMASRADFMEKGGEVSGMISGVKFYDEEPEDLNDIK
ncbi:Ni/Fe-hydrogenase, b-type cytochrome subunit [Dendrosporobacter sp. 1207_IL3150]|uniref:Ni/Fe-hydrogenase, b-type cytochrome subunit n=1 Tax=Dendrosporobacter sp. 1207_IL3150 TaxID=3084054 RepID=UPI002FDA1D6E